MTFNDFNPVEAFEHEVGKFLDVPNIVAVSNGTTALQSTIHALELEKDSWIITTPFSFMATANAPLKEGMKVFFVDTLKNGCNIDPVQVRKAIHWIQGKIGAIIIVHLFGKSCDMLAFQDIRKEYKIPIVEDTAQSFGQKAFGKHLGTWFDLGTFSTFYTKNFWTYEGGFVATHDDRMAAIVKQVRNHGRTDGGMIRLGSNWRMPWPLAFHGWQALRGHKEAIISELGSYGVEDGYYPFLIYREPWYQHNEHRWDKFDCPNAEKLALKARKFT